MIRNPFRNRWVVYLLIPRLGHVAPAVRELGRYWTRSGALQRKADYTNPPSGQAYASNWITVERLS